MLFSYMIILIAVRVKFQRYVFANVKVGLVHFGFHPEKLKESDQIKLLNNLSYIK